MKIRSIAEIRTGLNLNRKKAGLFDDSTHTYKSVTLRCFSKGARLQDAYTDTFTAIQQLDPVYLTRPKDVLVRLREPNYAIHIEAGEEEMVVPAFVAILRIHADIHPAWLAHTINADLFQRQLHARRRGTTISMIKSSDLAGCEIPAPEIHTQDAILDMMQLADLEIEKLHTLIRLKTQYRDELFETAIRNHSRAFLS